MIKQLMWTIWTPMSSVPKKADKLNLSPSCHQRASLGSNELTDIMAWICNYIHCFIWDVITHPCLSFSGSLTHLPLEKMVAILADDIFNCIFLNENDRIQIWISLNYVPRSQIDKKPALVQVMAWRRTGDKPLPEPTMTQFIDAYMRHWGEMS